jgi:hypothetical protein
MMRRGVGGIAVLVVAIQLATAASALASSKPPPIYIDPQANSPAGTIYAIPLDTARQDAAPHPRRGSSSGSGRSSSKAGALGAVGSGGSGGSGGGGASGGGGSAGSGGSGASGSASSGGGASGGGASGSASSGGGVSGGSSGGGGSGGSSVLVPGGQPGSLIHSSNGFGSSSKVPGLGAPASAGFRALGSSASNAPLLAILLALVVIALGVVAGGRAWRLSHPGAN